jgi:hypothetical protein
MRSPITEPESLGELIRNSDTIDANTNLKGTPSGVTIGDLWELFKDGPHREMSVRTIERRPAKPKTARIVVETFPQLQIVYDTLGYSSLVASDTDGDDAFIVRYVFS